MSKKNAKRLLSLLSSERFTSGEDIGKQLGISRAAVAKQIKTLQDVGVDIFSVHGKGYRLNYPVPVYSYEQLLNLLNNKDSNLIVIEDIIDSTNDLVKSTVSDVEEGFVCLAEGQLNGRGRQGKQWQSPFGSSIYLSMKWGFRDGYQRLSGLSLAVGVALLRVVKSIGTASVSLKWPNDVYVNSKKVAGILIEISGNADGSCDAIIGVGLNVRLSENVVIDQPWTDLNSISETTPNKNIVAANLINSLRDALEQFAQSGLSSFKEEWEEHDHFINQPIRLLIGQNEVAGIAKGITTTGALLMEVEEEGNKRIKEFSGGEISVRKA